VLPALSVAATVNTFAPRVVVSIAEPFATLPAQEATPDCASAHVYEAKTVSRGAYVAAAGDVMVMTGAVTSGNRIRKIVPPPSGPSLDATP
jgi:hypothetical protein